MSADVPLVVLKQVVDCKHEKTVPLDEILLIVEHGTKKVCSKKRGQIDGRELVLPCERRGEEAKRTSALAAGPSLSEPVGHTQNTAGE